ncbi:MAG: sigma-70 family RNA polymerase sigma factor [Verrucomicrobia bacterium]|nr:sigma-70 family RNA polymerase sigma factor [Verrucomicrobiota bacterium]
MSQVTQLLDAMQRGERRASEELLPLLYDELRRLAAHHLAKEPPGQTLQATALVHEAWLRLVGSPLGAQEVTWDGQKHFFAAAAEAMRRILIDGARRKKSQRAGGLLQRVELREADIATPWPDEDLLALHEALDKLAELDPPAAELIKLRFFAGLTHEQAARVLGLSRSAADRTWLFARAWLFKEIRPEAASAGKNGLKR